MSDSKTEQLFRVSLRGDAILHSPRWNKGSAFTHDERAAFGLFGRLPASVNTLDEQVERAYDQLRDHETPIAKNTFLQSMREQNWVLYYTLLERHLKELMPIIYTPTEADAISNYSHLFRRAEGMYLTFPNRDTMEQDYLEQTKGRDLELVVCSDGEAILGIGDQGVGGIGISTAKQAVYTLIAGINPLKSVAVTLDVGTNNEELLNDPLYVGWRNKRIRGEDYDSFIDKFVQLVRKHHPHCLLHFEDFGVTNAQRLLEKYREHHAVFNDDIQGTGAVTLSALMAAVGVTKSTLADQRIVIYGAGSAGLGIATQLRDAIVETDGLSRADATARFYLIDRHGLLKESLRAAGHLREGIDEFVRPDDEWADVGGDGGEIGLLDVVRKVAPTVLIGTSTHAGAFTEAVVRAMAERVERPIVFPLSNPSKLVEVDPKDANDWTGGKALLATGSPFPPAKSPSGGRDYIIAECNNALIYPGLSFGAILARSRTLTDTMIIAGARRLAALAPALKNPDDALLPDFADAPAVNFEVAVAVAERAIEEGSAGVDWRKEEVRGRVREHVWEPLYGRYEYDPEGEA